MAFRACGFPEADFVGLAATYCAGADDVVLTGIPAGGTFSVSPSIAGAIAGNVLIPSLLTPGTYQVTYTVSIDGSSCAGSITQSVEILDSPVATIDNVPASVCTQDDVITLSATPEGGTFSGAGVIGNTFDPMAAGTGLVTISYTATVTGSTCPAETSIDVQVNPSPVVSIGGLSGDYCLNSAPVALQGIPALGTFFIDGVETADATFNAASAGLGSHTIRYEFDNGTCIGFSEVTVNVVENISISFAGTPTEVCSEDDPFIISTNPSGATFTGLGVFGSTFSPKVAGPGTHIITANYSNGNCSATATHTITVNPSPVAAFNYNVNGATVSFNNASQNATTYSWDFGDGQTSTSVNPTHTYQTNGSYTITLTASNADCGESVFSAQLELSVGIGSIEGVDMIQLYPNPTRGMITLAFNSLNNQSFEVRITDATGRLIEVDAMTNYIGQFNKQYDLSDKAKGVYFFTVTSERGSINFRVVKD
jgi:PKD repeat protein